MNIKYDSIEYANDGKHKYIVTVNKKKIPFGSILYEDYLIHNDN